MTNKMTYAEALRNAIAVVTDETTKERLNDLLISVEKRNSAERKPTKTQSENAELKEQILNLLANEPHLRAMDVAHKLDLSSGQKASALLNQLVASEQVVVSEEKRVKYFSLAS